MAPPRSTDESSSSAQSIYKFPPPPTSSISSTFINAGANTKNAMTTISKRATTPQSTADNTTAVSTPNRPHHQYICSNIPPAAASFLLHRRLLLPTFAIPIALLIGPPSIVSFLSLLAYPASGGRINARHHGSLSLVIFTSLLILASTYFLVKTGKNAISKHAPNEKAKKRALKQSHVSLEFWSLVISIGAVRTLLSVFSAFFPIFGSETGVKGASMGWIHWVLGLVNSTSSWAAAIAGSCIRPAMGWVLMSAVVVCRYIGPFSPFVRCSCTPLMTNPFDATFQRIGRNFTSKTRFLDMIASWVDMLSSPSTPANNKIKSTTNNNNTQQMRRQINYPPLQPNAKTAATLHSTQFNNDTLWGSFASFVGSSANAHYSRPGLLSILVQVLINAIGGHIFAHTIVLPSLGMSTGNGNNGGAGVLVILLSCLFAPVFELFSNVSGVDNSRHELDFRRYSYSLQVIAILSNDLLVGIKRSLLGGTIYAPIVAMATIPVWPHLGPLIMKDGSISFSSLSFLAIIQSLLISYIAIGLLVVVMSIQDIFTRWAICAPGMDADTLMSQTPTPVPQSKQAKFLVEDLFVQSILIGDGATVKKVIAPPGAESNRNKVTMQNHQDDEINRNDKASVSFAEWIRLSSTTSPDKLSDDVLRMCLLESLGGGGSSSSAPLVSHSFSFGEDRHSAAIHKRLKISSATTSPGKDPIAVPLVRALCAFAGGIGEAVVDLYHHEVVIENGKLVNKIPVKPWILPLGSLNAAEFAIIAAARFVVMNLVTKQNGRFVVDFSKRHDRLSLLLPCVLGSAFKLRCGMLDYAVATADTNGDKISSFDKDGKGDGVKSYIAAKLPEISPVMLACDNSAKMVMQTIMECGDRALEGVLLRGSWKGEMQNWLVELNCQMAVPVAVKK